MEDILIIAILVTVKYADGIKCWNCIGDSCHLQNTNNDDNIQACHPEDYCQKVVYKMKELNASVPYISTVRSCSIGECLPTNETLHSECMGNSRLYQILGCSVRTCCNDRDMCNCTDSSASRKLIIVLIYVAALYMI